MEWSDEKPADLIHLYIYAGRDGHFELYEDEGTNYNYEQGAYSTIDIHYDDTHHTVTIGKRKGSFPGMLQQRQFNIILVTKDHPQPIMPDQAIGHLVTYQGKAIKINL